MVDAIRWLSSFKIVKIRIGVSDMLNMQGFGVMIENLKHSPKKIVFTEGTDERILEASSRLLAGNFLTPVLVGNPDEVLAAAEEFGYNVRGAQIIDPANYDRMDEMVELLCELRKSKNMQPEEARKLLSKSNYFGTMLVKMGVADALLGVCLLCHMFQPPFFAFYSITVYAGFVYEKLCF